MCVCTHFFSICVSLLHDSVVCVCVSHFWVCPNVDVNLIQHYLEFNINLCGEFELFTIDWVTITRHLPRLDQSFQTSGKINGRNVMGDGVCVHACISLSVCLCVFCCCLLHHILFDVRNNYLCILRCIWVFLGILRMERLTCCQPGLLQCFS